MSGIGVGMPALLYLEQFGSIVWDAFGTPPYLVGSALEGKEWRDVDVRLILPDSDYERMFGEPAWVERACGRWAALCMAFSALGCRMTGLPIDFQIQMRTRANDTYRGCRRQALGVVSNRVRGLERMSVDYPRAWEIARAAPLESHHSKCSFSVSKGGILCDCDVVYRHPEYLDDVLQTSGGEPSVREVAK
jgi:hypothetical protein